MQSLTTATAECKPATAEDSAVDRDWVLAQLRQGRRRAQLLINEIDWIGKALKSDWLSPDDAIEEMAMAGARFLYPEATPC
jgi:hypothetical protein